MRKLLHSWRAAGRSANQEGEQTPKQQSIWLKRYDRLLGIIDRASSLVIILLMGVLTVVILAQVFWRYVLNSSIDWSWDVPRLCFIWATLLAIPLGFKRHSHVGIDLVVNLLPKRARRLIIRINLAVMILMMLLVTYYAQLLAGQLWGNYLHTIPVSVGMFYVALFVSASHTILHMIRQFIEPPEPSYAAEYDVK